jgi:hypothetical protein
MVEMRWRYWQVLETYLVIALFTTRSYVGTLS